MSTDRIPGTLPDVATLERRVTIERSDEGYPIVAVTYHGPGLDRTDGYRVSMGPSNAGPTLAARLVRAIEAGVALGPPEVKVDIYGATYVSVTPRFLSRTLNADLRRAGF